MNEPLICEITRGTMVESRHRVHAVVMGPGGVHGQWGDPALMLYPRSAIKFLQALPLVESGAADKVGADERELALSAASHSGAPDHVAAVRAWLERMGLGEGNLGCGPHLPYDEEAAHDLIRSGGAPCRLHNNCSGKHTGFLATARHLGEDLDGYLDIAHPVQTRLYDILGEFSGESLSGTGRGIDGCGIPVYGMTLEGLARAVQRLARPDGVGAVRAAAIERMLNAITTHPYFVAGRARFDTDVMIAGKGRLATKSGAEGVHIALDRKTGIGVALKTEDGSKRAADMAMGWLLTHLGLLEDTGDAAVKAHLAPVIPNAAGDAVGTIRMHAPHGG